MIVPREALVVGLEGEYRLVAAILRQALADVQSGDREIWEEARQFFADRPRVDYFASLGGLDVDHFLTCVLSLSRMA